MVFHIATKEKIKVNMSVKLFFNKIEKNEMGGACGTYGGRERYAQGFGGDT